MPDAIGDIRDYYDATVDQELTRLERHPIERDITWRYLDAYLPPAGKILEIGAATGVYTIPLAKRGYRITAVDLSPVLLERCRQRVIEEGLEDKVTCLVADARDLSLVSETGYDAVLVMGPLYHLVEEEDRKTALQQVHARLKTGGVIFSAFISRYGIWGDVMMKFPEYIKYIENVRSVLEKGRDAPIVYWDNNFRAYFATVPEIGPLHQEAGFTTLVTAGMEPAGIGADTIYAGLTETQREKWLDLLYEISRESSILGASCHLLYLGRKL